MVQVEDTLYVFPQVQIILPSAPYTTGVTTAGTPGSSGAYTQIVVATYAPTLYYYCSNHSGMGATAFTPAAGINIKPSNF